MNAFADLRDSNRFRRSQPCPKCAGPSVVDWIDLVRRHAAHTCTQCRYYWVDFELAAAESQGRATA